MNRIIHQHISATLRAKVRATINETAVFSRAVRGDAFCVEGIDKMHVEQIRCARVVRRPGPQKQRVRGCRHKSLGFQTGFERIPPNETCQRCRLCACFTTVYGILAGKYDGHPRHRGRLQKRQNGAENYKIRQARYLDVGEPRRPLKRTTVHAETRQIYQYDVLL